MFELSAAEEQRALRLHKEATVIDTMGEYEVFTAETLKLIDDMIEQGASSLAIFEELYRRDARFPMELEPEWNEARKTSGLNAISTTLGAFGEDMFSFENALKDIANWTRKFDAVDDLVKVTAARDIERAVREDKMGIILNFQNSTHIGSRLDNLDFFYNLGIRIIQLTYNDLNLVGAGCTERTDCGLSKFGLKVVERMNELGMMVDVSHTGYCTTMDAIEASDAPVAFTHTVCKALIDHDRAKTDEQLEALAEKGGYCGIVVVPFFITESDDPTLAHFLDHVDHAVKVMGANKVGVGTDWGTESPEALRKKMDEELMAKLGFEKKHRTTFVATTKGYRDWKDFPNISRGLVSRGYSDEEVKGILGGNFLRIFREVVG
jgi:membrane dipeptidase